MSSERDVYEEYETFIEHEFFVLALQLYERHTELFPEVNPRSLTYKSYRELLTDSRRPLQQPLPTSKSLREHIDLKEKAARKLFDEKKLIQFEYGRNYPQLAASPKLKFDPEYVFEYGLDRKVEDILYTSYYDYVEKALAPQFYAHNEALMFQAVREENYEQAAKHRDLGVILRDL